MTAPVRAAALALALAWQLASPAPARAQAGERAATAEDLFRQALKLTKQGRFADACPRFAESARLDPAFGALMNLAACYERLGRTASAWQAYVDAADLARDRGQRGRADAARRKASQLAPRLVRLEIRLGAGVDPTELAVTRNDRPVDPALVGNAVPVDPGSYTIAASRAGAEPWSTSVTATEPGKTIVVEIAGPVGRAPAAEPPAAAGSGPPGAVPPTRPLRSPPPGEPRERDTASDGGRNLRIAGVAIAGGGAVLAVTGGVFGWLARSISDDYTHVQPGERFDPDREHRAKTYQTSAYVLWGVGAAAIAGGATAYLLGRRADAAGVSLAPAPLRGGAAAQVTWRW